MRSTVTAEAGSARTRRMRNFRTRRILLTIRVPLRQTVMRTLVLFIVLTLAATLSASSGHFPYIYKQGDEVTHIRNNRGSIEQIVATSKRWRGDYVWLERDGKEWLIRDANVLA